jgi:hypothetical protein
VATAPAVAAVRSDSTASQRFVQATTGQRYEIKAWATEAQAAALLDHALKYMEPDPFCRQGPQRNISFYLDSPRRTFFESHLSGAPTRYKLRVRTYDSPTSPSFLEVKRRLKAVVTKQRTTVTQEIGQAIIAGRLEAADALPPSKDLNDFLFLYQRYMVEPVLLVAARRLALSSLHDGGRFRLTFDRDIRYQRPMGLELRGRPKGWIPVDLIDRSGNLALLVLVEMKFVQAAPYWLSPALTTLGLRPTSFSKYIAALGQELAESDGWQGPHRGFLEDVEGSE